MLRFLLSRWSGRFALGVLVFLYSMALFAPMLAPYSTGEQDLQRTYHPPTALLWGEGGVRVQVYECVDRTIARYEPVAGKSVPLRWGVSGADYRWLGLLPMRWHLFGVEQGQRIYLLGSDETGRDVFSRLVYGSQVSLTIGLIGITLAMGIGIAVGGVAGYYGGWWDALAMRGTEVLMAIPSLYLLLALRAAFAERFTSEQMFVLITVILSMIGWAGTARVVRGLVLSLRERAFVGAAEVMGMGFGKLMLRHLLPNMAGYLLVTATLSVPGYILGEAALSFLGIGIQEPSASWGLMLAQAQQMKVPMLGLWWLLLPGAAIVLTVMAFNLLGDALRDWVDPKFRL